MISLSVVLILLALFFPSISDADGSDLVSPADALVWGPGLDTNFVVPVRYFFIQLKDTEGNNLTSSLGESPFEVTFFDKNVDPSQRIHIHMQQLDRYDGSYIMRYKMYKTYEDLSISIKYNSKHMGKSPYLLHGIAYHDACACPVPEPVAWLKSMGCPASYTQIQRDLEPFKNIVFSDVVPQVWERFNQSGSHSLCQYVIKDNQLYRSTMGKHVGFKMFSDAILLSLMRKVVLPDMEFYVNLGDWPLEKRTVEEGPLPIIAWCGSDDTRDIILPTYDITESTLETMGRVTLDLMSVQANTPIPWANRTEKVFWRGRDSRPERLELVKLSIREPSLIDAKLTNMFFYKHNKEEVGEIVKHVSFFSFFDYKYQINVDGTVAAYRLPYLLAGGSLLFKQESKYYEHFYKDLVPYVHYIPLKADLSDLRDKVKWAKKHDERAKRIADNGRQFVIDHLLAKDVFCYHVLLLQEYATRLKEVPVVQADMEKVEQPEDRFKSPCDCQRGKTRKSNDEL